MNDVSKENVDATESEMLDELALLVQQKRDEHGIVVPPHDGKLLTPEEAELDSQAPKEWLLEQAKLGRVPSCKVDGEIRFPRSPLKSAIVRMARGIIPPDGGEYRSVE